MYVAATSVNFMYHSNTQAHEEEETYTPQFLFGAMSPENDARIRASPLLNSVSMGEI